MQRSFPLLFCLLIFNIFLIYLHTNFDFFLCSSAIDTKETHFYGVAFSETNNLTDILDYVEKGADYILNLPRPPYILGGNSKGPKFLGNETCAPFPSIFRLKFSNVLWQLQEQSTWTFHLFGAYWDIRSANKDAPSIRILGMMNRMDGNGTIESNYCQIWFENQTEPLIAEINSYTYLWVKSWGNYNNEHLQPYLMNCPMPKNYTGSIPKSVSVVPSPCTPATNNLHVHFDKPEEKKMFAVCVKGMDFISPDWSTRLVEWIELLHIFGVDKIYFYDLAVHANVKKVYEYYENLDKIQVLPLTNAGDIPNEPHLRHAFLKMKIDHKRQHELIPYNDCLYRNMYKYKFISLLDIDEIIVPHNEASTWSELVDIVGKAYNQTDSGTSFFVFPNVHFNTEVTNKRSEVIPEHFYMLQHTTRNIQDAGKDSGIKCFHRAENILTLHNHFPTSCISRCRKIYVNHSDGFLHHYRSSATEGNNITLTYITDETLWRWKYELIDRSNRAIRALGFI